MSKALLEASSNLGGETDAPTFSPSISPSPPPTHRRTTGLNSMWVYSQVTRCSSLQEANTSTNSLRLRIYKLFALLDPAHNLSRGTNINY